MTWDVFDGLGTCLFSFKFVSSMTLCYLSSSIWSLRLANGLLFSAVKYAIFISFLTPALSCPPFAFPRQKHCLQVFCVQHILNNFPATTPCLWHSNDACSFTANLTKSTLSFMNVMSDNGFLRSILSFWETQTLQIIVFCSVIISQSCFFFHYFNFETFGSFRICWAAELTTNEAERMTEHYQGH